MRGRHDCRVEAQLAEYATQLATSQSRSLRHLNDKRREKSDDVAVVRQPNPVEAPPPLMLLHPRKRPLRATPALAFIPSSDHDASPENKQVKQYLPFGW
jgi:hypothetical protein